MVLSCNARAVSKLRKFGQFAAFFGAEKQTRMNVSPTRSTQPCLLCSPRRSVHKGEGSAHGFVNFVSRCSLFRCFELNHNVASVCGIRDVGMMCGLTWRWRIELLVMTPLAR